MTRTLWMSLWRGDFVEGGRGRQGVEVEHADGAAAGGGAADGHLGDVHRWLPKIVPTAPMMPGTSLCVKTSRMPSR